MVTLVNKNDGSKIIVPSVTLVERYYRVGDGIIDEEYHTYLDKDKWEIENE